MPSALFHARPGPGTARPTVGIRPHHSRLAVAVSAIMAMSAAVVAVGPVHATGAVPTFVDGLSQNVFSSNTADWIRGEAWVESSVDGDFDGKPDRIHVDFTLPRETVTDNLKVPVILEESPYYAGLGPDAQMDWPVNHELGFPPTSKPWVTGWAASYVSPKITTIYESTWLPRGFAVAHAESPGTGYSQGCPIAGGPLEIQAAKAVVDWLAGRATAYTSLTSTTVVSRRLVVRPHCHDGHVLQRNPADRGGLDRRSRP